MKLPFHRYSSVIEKGFTLIELLVVMAILGVLAVGLVAAINPTEKINEAADSRAISDFGVIARSAESYATARNGYYPYQVSDLVGANELKFAPVPPSNYVYNATGLPTSSCTASANAGTASCNGGWVEAVILQGAKYKAMCTTAPNTTTWYVYYSVTGKTCTVCGTPTSTWNAFTCP